MGGEIAEVDNSGGSNPVPNGYTIPDAKIERSFHYLLVSRIARSIGLNYVNLSLSLYLLALGFRISIIGVLFFLNVLVSTSISLLAGYFGDKTKYKYALIAAELPSVFAVFIIFISTNVTVIVIAMILSGVAGAPGAARGVFSPGSTALIATNWSSRQARVQKLGRLTSIGSFASVGGSLLLFFHGVLAGTAGNIVAFRELYLVAFFLILISTTSLLLVAERDHPRTKSKLIGKKSLAFSGRVMVSNSFNGAGIGLAIALLPAWFQIAYGVSSSQIGLVFTASYLATALGSYLASVSTSRTSGRSLMIGSMTRALQGVSVVLVAVMPTLFLAGVVYFARSLIAGTGMPFRTTINVSGITEGELGFGSSLQGSSIRFSQMTSGVSGYLTEVAIPLPLLVGGILQLFGGITYYTMLKSKEGKEEE